MEEAPRRRMMKEVAGKVQLWLFDEASDMKKLLILCVVGALALPAGCDRGELDPGNLPEVDSTAISDMVEITGMRASENRLILIIEGTARQELGAYVSLSVVRYKGEERLQETKTAFITYAGEPKVEEEGQQAFEPNWQYNDQGEKMGVVGPGGAFYPVGPDGKTPIDAQGKYIKDWALIYGPQASQTPDTIEAGDTVKIEVDGTMRGGRITKIVLAPKTISGR